MKRQAFTLVELLVIVAIIGILAAILFPVFAAARPATHDSPTQHLHELVMSELVYQNDYDGDFVLSATDLCNANCPSVNAYQCTSNLSTPALNWPLLLTPYQAPPQVFINPDTGDSQGVWSAPGVPGTIADSLNGSLPANALQFQNFQAQFGYNYEFLSPVSFEPRPGQTLTPFNCQASTEGGLGRNSGQAIHPGKTVMFASAQYFANPDFYGAGFGTPDYSFADAPGTNYALLPSEDRVLLVGSSCFGSAGSIGNPSYSANIGLGYCGWAGADPAGLLSANIRTISPEPTATIAWVDGHVSEMDAVALSAGTDFKTATAASHPDPVYGLNTGAIVNGLKSSGRTQFQGATNAIGLPAPKGYVWSLDGTLSDVN